MTPEELEDSIIGRGEDQWLTELYRLVWKEVLLRFEPEAGLDASAWLESKVLPEMRKQFDAYRDPVVNIDYSNPYSQAAYLIRSFIPYTTLVPLALCEALADRDWAETRQLVLLGGGPGPEIVGFAKWMYEKGALQEINEFTVVVLDRHADSWAWWYEALSERILKKLFDDVSVRIRPVSVDFCDLRSVPEDIFGSEHRTLIACQNVLNELDQPDLSLFCDWLLKHFERMANADLLVVTSKRGILGDVEWPSGAKEIGFEQALAYGPPSELAQGILKPFGKGTLSPIKNLSGKFHGRFLDARLIHEDAFIRADGGRFYQLPTKIQKWVKAEGRVPPQQAVSQQDPVACRSPSSNQNNGNSRRNSFTVKFEGTDYEWTGKGWVNPRTHLCPPKILVKQLEAKARLQFEKQDANITDFDELLSSAQTAKAALQFRRACKLAERAVQIDSSHVGAGAVLCACLRSLNESQRALDSTAHLAGSNYGPLLTSRAAAYCDLAEWVKAKGTIGRVLAMNAGNKGEAFSVVARIKAARPDLYSR